VPLPAPRRLLPVITAAALVVILAIAAAFLVLRGSGVSRSGRADGGLPPVAIRPARPGRDRLGIHRGDQQASLR
jgi:hypothetical protein